MDVNWETLEAEALQAHAKPTWTIDAATSATGFLDRPASLAPGEVVLIQIRPRGPSCMPRSTVASDLSRWNAAMGQRSR